MARKPAASPMNQHHCGRCPQSFNSRKALTKHLSNHPDSEPVAHKCTVCPFFFDDSLALEQHRILSGHQDITTTERSPQFECDRCAQTFNSKRHYNSHRELGQPCCDANHASDWKKNSRTEHVNADRAKSVPKEKPALAYDNGSTATPSEVSDSGAYCHDCKKTFPSQSVFIRHVLGCSAINSPPSPDSSPEDLRAPDRGQDLDVVPTLPTMGHHTLTFELPPTHVSRLTTPASASQPLPLQTVTLNVRQPVTRQALPHLNAPNGPTASASVASPLAPIISATGSASFICNINGCQRSYNSEPGLKMHRVDAHNVGGRGLDLHGKDSWMLGQRERERLQAEGLLKIHPTRRTRGGTGNRGGRAAPAHAGPDLTRAPRPAAPGHGASVSNGPYRQESPRHLGINTHPPLPTSQNIGGALEMEQAKYICGKTLRLLLQTDVFIHHDGKVSVGGNDWTRIGVARQSDAVSKFDEMCHLPRKLQSLEYVPAPKVFVKEYTAQYAVAEFESAPVRNPAKPGLGVIALACSKIVLANGCQEVVKIAAVDVLTCRILMSHLVCTNQNAQVSNWCSSVTGLTSFKDMEDAREAGFKILKGWDAARSALFRFIDKDTIIVGHNLRSDLDALRIVHGRAVDIAKVIEKAAQGPLSKAQVSLDSWCREVANVAQLKSDPTFGRDCVTNAFAAREIGLWAIKNGEKLEKAARQKAREYQSVNPITV